MGLEFRWCWFGSDSFEWRIFMGLLLRSKGARVSTLEVGFLDFGATYGHESIIKSDNKDTRKWNMQLIWGLRIIIENFTSFGPLPRRSGMKVIRWLKLVLEYYNDIPRHSNDIEDWFGWRMVGNCFIWTKLVKQHGIYSLIVRNGLSLKTGGEGS